MLDIMQSMAAWALPRICVCCGFNSHDLYVDLCAACKAHLPWIDERCYQCGVPILKPTESIICDKCQQCAPPYNRLCALFCYQQPLIRFIGNLKFGRQLFPGRLFAQLMIEAVQQRWYNNIPLPEALIPVPLHIRRHRARGYNQVTEICTPMANGLNIHLDANWCQRTTYTTAQSRLGKEARQRNLGAAFSLNSIRHYKHVALVDDVVTTASTIKAVSVVLQTGGVENIDVWCVCRA